MLSHAKYPYMNRAQRRDPVAFDGSRVVAMGCAVSRLMWALLVRAGVFATKAGYVPDGDGYANPSLPTAISTGIRAVGKSIAAKAVSVWRKLFG